MYPINVKTAEPIGPKFFVRPHVKNFENAQKNIMKSAHFFVFVLYCTKRRCSEIKPQLKVEIEDGREAP